MEVTKRLLDKIDVTWQLGAVRFWSGSKNSFVANCLREIRTIEVSHQKLMTEIDDADVEHKKVLAAINSRVCKIQEHCAHFVTTHHPDPSGGSDSFTKCEVCDKEL